MTKTALFAGAALAMAAPAAHAALITTASLFTPQPASGSVTTAINLSGISTPSRSTVNRVGYSIQFSTDEGQGVVRGALGGRYAIPVAGVSGGQPTYFTRDFGSALTTDAGASGNYLSTGGQGSSIVLTFALPQNSFALLWGSIDEGNTITFGNAAGDVLTGAAVQALSRGFAGNGSQGPAGSAYVASTSNTPFNTVTLRSSNVSFEAAALVGSDRPFNVPEPLSLALLGAGLAGLGFARRFYAG